MHVSRFSRLAGLILTLVLIASLSAAPPPPAGWTDGYVLANGIRIHYWRTGSGEKPPMVLAHGSSDDGLCWTNFAKEFTANYDIILIDARGHGLSDPPKPGDPVDVQADDLAGLIRELKLQKPIVMGHSMGSAAAAMFAAKYPDIPRAVILEDPYLGPRRTANPASPDERRKRMLERNNLSEEALVTECMKNTPQWGKSECEIWAPSKRRHHPDTALGSIERRPAMSELFSKITVPTLIVKADADAAARAENEKATAILKHGKIVHIDGAGHNVRRDRKEETIRTVRNFLSSLPNQS